MRRRCLRLRALADWCSAPPARPPARSTAFKWLTAAHTASYLRVANLSRACACLLARSSACQAHLCVCLFAEIHAHLFSSLRSQRGASKCMQTFGVCVRVCLSHTHRRKANDARQPASQPVVIAGLVHSRALIQLSATTTTTMTSPRRRRRFSPSYAPAAMCGPRACPSACLLLCSRRIAHHVAIGNVVVVVVANFCLVSRSRPRASNSYMNFRARARLLTCWRGHRACACDKTVGADPRASR